MDEFLTEIPDHPIEGERVLLRQLDRSDCDALYAVIDGSREFLARHLPWPGDCVSAEDVFARIDSWNMQAQMGNGACWGIFEKGEGAPRVAGCIVLGWVQWMHLSANVSYWLGEGFTGRGLATEALRLVSQFAFTELGLHRLELSASVSNVDSQNVAVRGGFTEEGVSRDFERINGIFEDHVRFSRLAQDAGF